MNAAEFYGMFLALSLLFLTGIAAILRGLELLFPSFSTWLDERFPEGDGWNQWRGW